MGYARCCAAVLAAGALLAGVPAAAQTVEAGTKLRHLDMMLMVTSLRCRFGADDFQADYDAFRAHNAEALKEAAVVVLDDMTRRLGRNGAVNEYDRMSTGMANTYGLGHPTLGCADLKQATEALTAAADEAALLAAADQLLDAAPASPVLLAQR